jgi:hypothetical protein
MLIGAFACHEPTGGMKEGDRADDTASAHSTVGFSHTGDLHSADPLSWVWLDNGYRYSCGLLTNGRQECWGREEWARTAEAPSRVQFDLSGWSGCGLDAAGRIECWCPGGAHQACKDVPQDGGYVQVRCGDYGACAEDGEHRLHCWGYEAFLAPPDEPVDDWDLEINGGCAVVAGEIECWGDFEELWAMSPDADPLPPSGGGFVQVTVGRSHGCALDKVGEVHCWGSTGLRERFPDPPPGPFVRLETYNQISCGMREDGHVECWYHLPGILDLWSWPQDEVWAQFSLGEWDGCGVTVDGRGLCFPAEFESDGEQQVPDLDEL